MGNAITMSVLNACAYLAEQSLGLRFGQVLGIHDALKQVASFAKRHHDVKIFRSFVTII
jgi:hypothetical protein